MKRDVRIKERSNIDGDNLVTFFNKSTDKIYAEKTGTAGYKPFAHSDPLLRLCVINVRQVNRNPDESQ